MTTIRCLYSAAVLLLVVSVSSAWAEEAKSPWKARAEASYVRTSGNSSTETGAAKLEASYEPNANRFYAKAGALSGKSDGVTTANRYFLDGRYERALTDRLLAFVNLNVSRDSFSGYSYQWYGGPGIGYEFLKTDAHRLKGLASLLYAYDRFSGDEGYDSYVAAMAAVEYEWKITDSVKFKEVADYRVSLKDSGVYFINSTTSLEVKLAAHLALGLGYTVNYRNELPKADLKHTDTTFLASLIVTL